MDCVSVKLDSTLSFYTGSKEVVVNIATLKQPITVGSLLRYLKVPPGMVGSVINGKCLLLLDDTVDISCELKVFGIYSGG